MFLQATIKANPELIQYATWLHRTGGIPPNTYVIDLDTTGENAARLVASARANRLQLYAMTKQFGRNPMVMKTIADAGTDKVVAVDIDEARVMRDAGLKVGHVGHLVACAKCDIREVLLMKPEVVTVYCYEQAEEIDRAAKELGVTQDVLLRIFKRGNYFHPGQQGGFTPETLETEVNRLRKLNSILIVGVTAHPCLIYDYETGEGGEAQNLQTLLDVSAKLLYMGVEVTQINAPGVNCCATIPLLAQRGVTHAEPGSAFTGSTPLHAYSDQPEIPSMVYVSEVSHRNGERVYTFGGGFYSRGHIKEALVGRDVDEMFRTRLPAEPLPPGVIDYYGTLLDPTMSSVRPGDTVVYAFRTQIFVTRALVAVVAGLRTRGPFLKGLFDSRGRPYQTFR